MTARRYGAAAATHTAPAAGTQGVASVAAASVSTNPAGTSCRTVVTRPNFLATSGLE